MVNTNISRSYLEQGKVSGDESFHICVDHDDIEVQNDEPEGQCLN